MKCTAIILAGSRGTPDALCIAHHVGHKALIPIAGQSMLVRVVEALLLCDHVGDILIAIERHEPVLGLPALGPYIDAGRVRLIPAAASPSETVLAAIHAAQNDWPLLVTTADHPLLRSEMIDYLFAHAPSHADAVAAVVEEAVIRAAYPETVRTYMRFRDSAVSGANLFLLLGPDAGKAVAFWRYVEANRKRPWRLMMTLGIATIFRFVTGRLDLARALEQLGRHCGARLGVVRLPFAEGAIDVDKPGDLALVTRIIEARGI